MVLWNSELGDRSSVILPLLGSLQYLSYQYEAERKMQYIPSEAKIMGLSRREGSVRQNVSARPSDILDLGKTTYLVRIQS